MMILLTRCKVVISVHFIQAVLFSNDLFLTRSVKAADLKRVSFIYFLRAKCMIYVFTDMLILETAYSLQRSCIHAAWTGSISINKVLRRVQFVIMLVIICT